MPNGSHVGSDADESGRPHRRDLILLVLPLVEFRTVTTSRASSALPTLLNGFRIQDRLCSIAWRRRDRLLSHLASATSPHDVALLRFCP
jgi:hypothetical protein